MIGKDEPGRMGCGGAGETGDLIPVSDGGMQLESRDLGDELHRRGARCSSAEGCSVSFFPSFFFSFYFFFSPASPCF